MWEMYFHNSLGIKVVHAGHVNAVLIGQQKQQKVPLERIIKLVAAVYVECAETFVTLPFKLINSCSPYPTRFYPQPRV